MEGTALALLAETLVEEWMNRRGYFTIRGMRAGSNEVDLLAILPNEDIALHVEVSVAPDPNSWICGWTKRLQKELGYGPNYNKPRTQEQMEECAEEWVRKKFIGSTASRKVEKLREELWPNRDWRRIFVHGRTWQPEELTFIEGQGVDLLHIRQVLRDLKDPKLTPHVTSAEASDIVKLMDIWSETEGS